jgi:hypothetical protein
MTSAAWGSVMTRNDSLVTRLVRAVARIGGVDPDELDRRSMKTEHLRREAIAARIRAERELGNYRRIRLGRR